MRKILSLVLGLLWALPVWGACYDYTSATGTVSQAGTPTPENPIEPTFYTQGDMILRAVGDYKDTFDATTGKITRRVGVKVLDGTENTINTYNMLQITAILNPAREKGAGWQRRGLCTHAVAGTANNSSRLVEIDATATYFGGDFGFTAASGKQWLRDQYAAGTPVTLYYPLAEPVEEDWTETSYCETPIKIATTKYNESAFGPLNTALANAISVVDTVVSNTITQAASIATLQTQKQTRPNDIADDSEKCPAGKKCLLVEDASGIPHWYEIVERYSRLPDGYTELEYINMPAGSYLQTDIVPTYDGRVEMDFQTTTIPEVGGSFMGGRSGSYPSGLTFGFNANESFIFDGFSANRYQSTNLLTNNTRYKYTWNNQVAKLETGDSVVGTNTFTGTGTTTHPLFINGANNAGSVIGNVAGIYLYSFKAWNAQGTSIANLIPAKDAGGVVGMYDTVSGTFFENAGTGDFVAGPVAE